LFFQACTDTESFSIDSTLAAISIATALDGACTLDYIEIDGEFEREKKQLKMESVCKTYILEKMVRYRNFYLVIYRFSDPIELTSHII
jgi:hypothetical protein